jgi:hypothetical protein
MTYTFPSHGSTNWDAPYEAIINDIDARIAALEAGVAFDGSKMGRVWLDDFGNTDGAFTSALSTVGADTHPRAIFVSNRSDGYTWSTVNRVPPRGLKIYGPPGFTNPEVNSQQKMNCRVNLTGSGSLFVTSGADNWDQTFADLTFICNAGSSFLGHNGDAFQWKGLKVGNLAQKSGNGLLGTFAEALNCTVFTGFGHIWINGNTDTAVHLKGSDMHPWWTLFADSAVGNAPAGGHAHVMYDFADFTTLGPHYITAEGNWGAIDFLGGSNPLTSSSNNSGAVRMFGLTATGRNPTAPCNGAPVRVKGGIVMLIGGEIAWGMSNPAAMGRSPTDTGLIMQTGGVLHVDGMRTDRSADVLEGDAENYYVAPP